MFYGGFLEGGELLLSTVTCLAGMTGKRGGGCCIRQEGGAFCGVSSCTVLPQWLQVKRQMRESLRKMGTGRLPVNVKPFAVQV